MKRFIIHATLLLLLLAFFAQGMAHIRSASITFDEGPHLATGYATLRTGDFRLQPIHIHPPLANVLAAAPLLLQNDLPDPRAVDGWEIASLSAITDAVVWQYPHPERLAVAGRLPILWLAVLLGALLCRWARDLGGARAGLLALALYAFDPNMIAHGTLITTDMAATFLMVTTLYAASQRIGEKAKRREGESANRRQIARWVGVGVLLGLALLTKVSALILAPVLGLMVASYELRVTSDELRPASSHISRFTFHAVRITQYVLALALPAALVLWAGYGFEIGRVAGWPYPIPAATHIRIYQSLQEHYQLGHPTFLLGQVSSHGWWWYFPVAFMLKTPLPVLLLALYALIHTACYLRHRPYGLRITHYALLLWLALGTLTVAPDYLAFFNEFAGGPAGGYRYLVDSNLDWGQNLWQLRDWMQAHDETHIYYAHYSPARPAVYGIEADFLPPDPRAVDFTPWQPAPGLYAIGATVLQGPYAPDVNTYAWFRAQKPLAQLGHALFLYRVEAATPPAWAVLCAETGLSPEQVRVNLGQPALRVLQPDCDAAQVYAAGPGILIAAAAADIEALPAFHLRAPNGAETARIFRTDAAPAPARPYPVAIEGPLDFLGYAVIPMRDDAITLRTYWRVKERPTRPLSLMAHLIAPDGTTLDVGDGMGFPVDQWQPNDIIVQYHHLRGAGRSFRIGAYWLDTMERWTVGGDGDFWIVQD